ncbi:MAG: GMC family oxidoreductase [Acidimicrobiia bacterium]|nr:GMC family oxidoreductase [Acidimicrobiia bacterium]
MLIDAAQIEDGSTVEADLCIVGGGLAGLALASVFLDTDSRVVLLESGPLGEDPEADDLSEGTSTVHPSVPLSESAPRRLGGAAETWGAWCRPMEDIDFEERDWPWSGWPISGGELAPYFQKALEYLEMSDRGFTGRAWADGLPPLYRHIQDDTGLLVGVWQESPLAPISERVAGGLKAAQNLDVHLGATALEIRTRPDGDRVIGIEAGTLNGKRFSVQAHQYVLAGGTLGTVRLLLASRDRSEAGVGNEHGMVGRFFAEHPHIVAGRITLSRANGRPRFPAIDRGLGGTLARIEMERPKSGIRAGIYLGEDVRRREGLLNVIAHLRPPSVEPPRVALEFFRELRHKNLKKMLKGLPGLLRQFPEVVSVVYRRLLKRPRRLELYVQTETLPNPDSRVVLSDEKDRFGMPRAELQWHIGARDKEQVARTVELMGDELEAMGLGSLELEPWLSDSGEFWSSEPFGGLHLMGTTRMSVVPEEGVVDPAGRVHGVDNLWIVGPSVFPTYGAANPGMTIVATALRTADQVAQVLAGPDLG